MFEHGVFVLGWQCCDYELVVLDSYVCAIIERSVETFELLNQLTVKVMDSSAGVEADAGLGAMVSAKSLPLQIIEQMFGWVLILAGVLHPYSVVAI